MKVGNNVIVARVGYFLAERNIATHTAVNILGVTHSSSQQQHLQPKNLHHFLLLFKKKHGGLHF